MKIVCFRFPFKVPSRSESVVSKCGLSSSLLWYIFRKIYFARVNFYSRKFPIFYFGESVNFCTHANFHSSLGVILEQGLELQLVVMTVTTTMTMAMTMLPHFLSKSRSKEKRPTQEV